MSDLNKVAENLLKALGDPDEAEEEEDFDIEELENTVFPLIALRGITVFPGAIANIELGREKSKSAADMAMMRQQQKVVLLTQKEDSEEIPPYEGFYEIGVMAKIKQLLRLPNGNTKILVEGLDRVRITAFDDEGDESIVCQPVIIPKQEYDPDDPEIESYRMPILSLCSDYDEYDDKTFELLADTAADTRDMGEMADAVANQMLIGWEKSQMVLQTLDIKERLKVLVDILSNKVNVLKLENDVKKTMKSQLDQNQKEYYLREEIKAIKEELGENEDAESDANQWMETIRKKKLPKKVAEKMEKEIKKYRMIPVASAEGNVTRTYIETVLDLPWNTSSRTRKDMNESAKILNRDHYGMQEVKDRILEYLAVVKLSGGVKGQILCLVGPPGVGKTSIAKSVAEATGRKFVRMSLGGVRDEAEIRGHRRTYVGSIPGRVMNCISEVGVNNPVFLLDEIDKLGADFKGDPSSALLEVLDPEQNKDFVDHYLEVPFDLSKVLFITTANDLSTVPAPLLDRMEVIELSGYTEEEKLHIAKKYLIPKQIKANGLKAKDFSINEKALRELINFYTRESGVRNLEREISSLCRKAAYRQVTGKAAATNVTAAGLGKLLGKKKYRYDVIGGETEVGVTTGMAWTAVGGDTLFIESAIMPGSGKLEITGQLGDVMQESAKTAVSYIRSISEKVNMLPENKEFFKDRDLHIHVPEGAVPKDGPSAGITLCMSLLSTLTGHAVRKDVSMTGEITLTGKILPVGGIKEKVLAAYRAGIRKILLPRDNERDIEEIPPSIRKQIEFVLLSKAEDALDHVFADPKKIRRKNGSKKS